MAEDVAVTETPPAAANAGEVGGPQGKPAPVSSPEAAPAASPVAEPITSAPASPPESDKPQGPLPVLPPVAETAPEPIPAAPIEKPLNFLADHDEKKATEDAARAAKAAEELKEPAKPAKDEKPAEKEEKAEEPKESGEKPPEKKEEPEKLAEPTEKVETEAPEPKVPEPFSLTDLEIPDDFVKDFERGRDYLTRFQEAVTKPDLTQQQRAQTYLDLHTQAMRDYGVKLAEDQRKVWRATQQEWANAAMADERIGGSNFDNAMGAIARVRDKGLRTEAERKGFNEFLNYTGAGVNPWFLRFIHNLADYADEPQASTAPAQIKPPLDNGQRPGRRSAVMYDHERSKG